MPAVLPSHHPRLPSHAWQVVYDELRSLMGGQQAELTVPKYGPSVILMAGLQVGCAALGWAAQQG